MLVGRQLRNSLHSHADKRTSSLWFNSANLHGEFNLLKTVCMVSLFCAAAAIASPAQTLTTLVSFNGANGYAPTSSLIEASDGNFYGTTSGGGNIACDSGCGTAFKVTPDGRLTTLYNFCSQQNCPDGRNPYAGLVQGADGNFYGTTKGGGIFSDGDSFGTVFKITPTGALTTLYRFCAQGSPCPDGAWPHAGLVLGGDGNFYGTTSSGGDSSPVCEIGCGTVFKITPNGALTTLYRFCSQGMPCPDGAAPNAGLVQGSDGNFYGTTLFGGSYGGYCDAEGGCGTVYKITFSGMLTTLHSFSGPDGNGPDAGLVQSSDGNFYGTTTAGGASGNCDAGCGTVFKITPSGALTNLYSFCSQSGCTDGQFSFAGLVQATDHNFYGTTSAGGSSNFGTVFRITPSGALTTLYSFCSQPNCTDGENGGDGLQAGLVQGTDGNFYGATIGGGTSGDGTVFSLTPPVTVTSADLVSNAVDVTLSGQNRQNGQNGQMGVLTLILNGINNQVTVEANDGNPVGPGQYQISFDRPSIPPDTYSSITVKWDISPPASTTFNISQPWLVLGVIRHSQYNTPYESTCPGGWQRAWYFDASCNFTSVELKSRFVSQTYKNGTGASISYGILKYDKKTCAGEYPPGANPHNAFLQVANIQGSCINDLDDTSVAMYPDPKKKGNPYNCGDDILLVDADNKDKAVKTAEDYCPVCYKDFGGTDGHIDDYTTVKRCTFVGDYGNFWTADTVGQGSMLTSAIHSQHTIQQQTGTGLFDPTHNKPPSYRDEELSIHFVSEDDIFQAIIETKDGRPVKVAMPDDIMQVDSVVKGPKGTSIVLGMVNGSVYEVVALDIRTRGVSDHFYAYNPTLSPDGHAAAFVKFYPPHFVDGTSDHYMLYDFSRSAASNRPSGEGVADSTNIGVPVYPPEIGNQEGDNIGVPDSKSHQMASETFFWESDSRSYLFADTQGVGLKLVLVHVGVSGGSPLASTLPIPKAKICPAARANTCELRLVGVKFQEDGIVTKFRGIGVDASVQGELLVRYEDFRVVP